jgi:hypothetical protein
VGVPIYVLNSCGEVEMAKNQRHQVKGGLVAHLFRRLVHLASIFVLWLYYHFGTPELVLGCLAVVLILELIRLNRGWSIFGQRPYEKGRLSAFAWSAMGIALVLLLLPEKRYAVPIICAYAIGDPLLGELRCAQLNKILVIIAGILVIAAIWYGAHLYFGTPLWLLWVMAPLTVAAEWPRLSWVDDNFLMQAVPLLFILILRYFHPEVMG